MSCVVWWEKDTGFSEIRQFLPLHKQLNCNDVSDLVAIHISYFKTAGNRSQTTKLYNCTTSKLHLFVILNDIHKWKKLFLKYIFFTTPYLFSYLKLFIAEFCENLSNFVNFCYVTSQNSAEEVASGRSGGLSGRFFLFVIFALGQDNKFLTTGQFSEIFNMVLVQDI